MPRQIHRSQSFGQHCSNSLGALSLANTQSMSLYRKLTKNELELKLHETLCEKDKLVEQAASVIREKLDQDNAMIQLVHENGILKEENLELKDARLDISLRTTEQAPE